MSAFFGFKLKDYIYVEVEIRSLKYDGQRYIGDIELKATRSERDGSGFALCTTVVSVTINKITHAICEGLCTGDLQPGGRTLGARSEFAIATKPVNSILITVTCDLNNGHTIKDQKSVKIKHGQWMDGGYYVSIIH